MDAGEEPDSLRTLCTGPSISYRAWGELQAPKPGSPHLSPPSTKSTSCVQVLLSLSDEDLELGLGVCSSLHRRKLRLAIEDYRDAEAGRR